MCGPDAVGPRDNPETMIRKLFNLILLRLRHWGEVRLYDNVWRRPDGVDVDDQGRVWDKHWQNTIN